MSPEQLDALHTSLKLVTGGREGGSGSGSEDGGEEGSGMRRAGGRAGGGQRQVGTRRKVARHLHISRNSSPSLRPSQPPAGSAPSSVQRLSGSAASTAARGGIGRAASAGNSRSNGAGMSHGKTGHSSSSPSRQPHVGGLGAAHHPHRGENHHGAAALGGNSRAHGDVHGGIGSGFNETDLTFAYSPSRGSLLLVSLSSALFF
jgi:hypothetical protein